MALARNLSCRNVPHAFSIGLRAILSGASFLFIYLSFAVISNSQILQNRYVVTLQGDAVSARFVSRSEFGRAEASAYRKQIEDRQAAIRKQLASRGIAVTGSVSVLQNIIFVNAPAARVQEILNTPGVLSVQPMRRFKPALNRATQLMNAPAAWTKVGGQQNAGAGVKVAILDSGIDQNHPVFHDTSLQLPAGFPKCTQGHPEDCAFTTNKVIVARSYVRLLSAGSSSSNPAADDVPDDYSPRDRDGHGTAVASIVAAAPTITPAFSSAGQPLTIQGMAPKAFLGNYKIAGSPGVEEFASDQTMIQAVEDAVTDGMDIITTSFGSPALSDAASDPVAAAFEAAAKAGVVVTVAAGNNGAGGTTFPSFNSILSPSNAPDVISVGATENSHVLLPSVSADPASAPASLVGMPAQPSDSFNFPSTFGAGRAPLVDVTNLGDNGLACSALPAFSLAGAFALIERGTCTFAAKATNASNAGAIGIVFYMADASAPIVVEGLDPTTAAFIGPAVMISNASGTALKAWIDSNPGKTITIDSGGTEVDIAAWSQSVGISPAVTGNMLAAFSSTGPAPDGQLKPDIVATGGNDLNLAPDPNDFFLPAPSGLYMATQSYDPNQSLAGGSNYSANGYWAANGTSFAAPMAAGAAALVKQANTGKNLRATQIKSLLVNSATQNVVTTDDFGDPVDVQWIGAGLLNAGAAATANITAEPSTISFGILKTGSLPVNKSITLSNIGSSAATLSAAASCCFVNGKKGTLSSIQVTLGQSSISIAAGASATLSVSLTGAIPAPGEYSGTVSLTQGSTVTSLPFLFLVGNGIPANVNILSAFAEGAPGQDVGATMLQVTDQYGVPVAASPVSFTVSPANGVTLATSPGHPACATNGSVTTCNTDQFGVVYAEVTLGSTVGNVTAAFNAGGITLTPDCTFATECYSIKTPPAITGVGDAALQGGTKIVPGAYMSIYGTRLSNSTSLNGTALSIINTPIIEATDPVVANGAVLPLQIDYVTVSFDVPSAGISAPGHVTFVSPGQVNVQVPWELQGQSSAQVKVTVNGDLFSNVVTVPLATASPEFFLTDAVNSTAAAVHVDGRVAGAAAPVAPGETILMYANGLGAVSNQPASGDPAGSNPLSSMPNAQVTIGGQPAQVTFTGLTPTLPGLYQLNVTVPGNAPSGVQNVTLAVGGVTSPVATLPIQ